MKNVRSWSKPENFKNIIGVKKVDWSIFEYGTHIPIEFHVDFAEANENQPIDIGSSVKVDLLIDDETFKANLSNISRKDSEKGSLQLRYDTNHELKEKFKKIFQTSYKYLKENKEEKSKKPVHTPEHLEEFIEFYKTDKPFVYRLRLKNKSDNENRSYWWVNQGKSYVAETTGGYLWAPQKMKNGKTISHHRDLVNAQVGDVVFAYSTGEIKSVGIVTENTVEEERPSELSEESWDNQGYMTKVDYHNLNKTIQKEEISESLRTNEQPFDRNTNVKQGYFFSVSNNFAQKIYSQFGDRFPTEVKECFDETEYQVGNNISMNTKELVDHVHSYINCKGFYYDSDEVTNLILSLKTKPFVIISGISGTGKTMIVRWLTESVGATSENNQFTQIAVRPDWSDSSDLLGFVDIKGEFQEGPLTKIIIEALKEENANKPYFLLLDEMNLARVEHYFSDILSVMESRKWENDIAVTESLFPNDESKKHLHLPSNLYIIGTVNMDETTHPFSKKVLDRANTIEFNRIKLDDFKFLENKEEVDPVHIDNKTFATKYLHLKDLYEHQPSLVKKVSEELVEINKIIQLLSAQVGYRVRDEICFYMANNEEADLMTFDQAFDYCILQKILPRLSGSDSRIERVLRKLYQMFTSTEINQVDDVNISDLEFVKYPKSTEKVVEMLRRFEDDGFTSFWIA